MAVTKGKRRRRDRRRTTGGDQTGEFVENSPAKAKTKSARPGRKPLAERSPLIPGGVAVLCLAGAVFSLVMYRTTSTVNSHGHVTGGPSTFGIVLGIFYIVATCVEGYLAYRIYRARGSWR